MPGGHVDTHSEVDGEGGKVAGCRGVSAAAQGVRFRDTGEKRQGAGEQEKESRGVEYRRGSPAVGCKRRHVFRALIYNIDIGL